MKPEHVGMLVVAALLATLAAIILSGCEFSVGIGVDIQSHPTDELPSDFDSTIPDNCHITTNTTINEWKLKHCDHLSDGPKSLGIVTGPASLQVAGIGGVK
jgi:predicted small secreted protein